MYVDIVVIVPLETEFQEFTDVFTLDENLTNEGNVTYKFSHEGITGIVILQSEMGYWGATTAANSTLGEFQFGLMICLGIAGRLSDDLKVGDVCYSSTIIDTVSNGKIEDEDAGGEKVALAPEFLSVPKKVYGPLNYLRIMPELRDEYLAWQGRCQEFALNKAGELELEDFNLEPPQTFQGDIACGFVSKSLSYKKKLQGITRKILAIETESGAIARFCTENDFHFLAIRGISDDADNLKNQFEQETKNAGRLVAASNASSFLKTQVGKNEFFRQYLVGRRPTPANLDQPRTPALDQNFLSNAQSEGFNSVVARLRKINQSFRTLPEGQVLPMPRLRQRPSGAPGASAEPKSFELRDAVSQFERLFVTIPRVFPDKSLAWLMAYAMHYEQLSDTVLLPIVIDGQKVSPPRGSFERLAKIDIDAIKAGGGTPVFIVENFDITSETRSAFLTSEMKKYEGCRTIVLCDDVPDFKQESRFTAQSNASHFDVTDPSFSEISGFLSSHFEIATDEAHVVALRLQKTFRKFGLQVHPTFFAGLPQEVIASILNANRRGELLQLAVDGYMTFVVANDPEEGRLSRTTRSEFLRKFIRLTKIEKSTMSVDDVYSLAADLFEERALPNNPRNFIDQFIDKSVLITRGEKIEFGLNFIESYYVAIELAASTEDAVSYFDFDDKHFDFRSFDIYAELSASEDFVGHLIEGIQKLELYASDNKDAIVSGKIHPRMMRKDVVPNAVRRRLEIAQKAIEDGKDETKRKQRLLDVAERVYEQAYEVRDEENSEENKALEHLDNAMSLWSIAVVLFGQGAERIGGKQKAELAKHVLRLGGKLIDEWTALNATFNYADMKDDLTSVDVIDQIVDPEMDLPSQLSRESLVSVFVDMIEMTAVTDPLRSILHHIAEEARHKVVLPPVRNAQPQNYLEQVIHASWLAEIDANSATAPLEEMVRDCPKSPFLRSALTTHYLTRVYWSLSDKKTRIQLLNTADKLMRSVGKKLQKGEILRQIESENQEEKA